MQSIPCTTFPYKQLLCLPRCIISLRGSFWPWGGRNDLRGNLSLTCMQFIIFTPGRSFWTSTSKERGSLALEIKTSDVLWMSKQCSWSSFLLILLRFCITVTSSSCLFSSLFKLYRKCCAFPIRIWGGIRPCYLVLDKTTVVFCSDN